MRLLWSAVGDAVALAAGVAFVPPMACHGVPWHPRSRHEMPWDVMVCRGCHAMGCHGMPWYAMSGTMSMPRPATKKANSVEPWIIPSKTPTSVSSLPPNFYLRFRPFVRLRSHVRRAPSDAATSFVNEQTISGHFPAWRGSLHLEIAIP